MADLAQLGIRVDYNDPQNAEKKLKGLETQARKTQKATDALSKTSKKKGTDALNTQAKATDKLRNNSGALMARLQGLNNKIQKVGQSTKGIQDLKTELTGVNKSIRESDKLPLNTYNKLARKSSDITSNLREQNKALKDNAKTASLFEQRRKAIEGHQIALNKQRQASINNNIQALGKQKQAYLKYNKQIINSNNTLNKQRQTAIEGNKSALDKQRQAYEKFNQQVTNSYQQADKAAQSYNKNFQNQTAQTKQGLDKQVNSINKLQETAGFWKSNAAKVKTYQTQISAAQKSLTNLQGTLSKQDFNRYSKQLAQAGHNLDYVGKRANFAHSRLREFWERFGQVGLGFGAIYGAIRAVGAAFHELFSILKEGIQLSGEIASLQAKLATYHTVAVGIGETTETFSKKMDRAEGNIMALARASLNSASSFDDLQTAMDEFAQHSIFVGKEWMGAFTAFTDFVSLIAQTTGNTASQIRSEISGLMEGLARPQNVVIRMLMRTGMLTDELLTKIRNAENAGKDIKQLILDLEPVLGKLQKKMIEVDVGTLFNKWRDTMKQSIAEATNLASAVEDTTNIFGAMLNKHRKWGISLIESKEQMKVFADAMKFLRTVLDAAATGFEKIFTGAMHLFAFLERYGKILASATGTIIAYKVANAGLVTVLGKVGGVLKFLLSPIGKVWRAFKSLYTVLVLNFSEIKDMVKKRVIPSLAKQFRRLSTATGKLNKKLALTPAAIYVISVAIRALHKQVKDETAWKTFWSNAQTAFEGILNDLKNMLKETARLLQLDDAWKLIDDAVKFWSGKEINLGISGLDEGTREELRTGVDQIFGDLNKKFKEGLPGVGAGKEIASNFLGDFTKIIKKDVGRLGAVLSPIKKEFRDLWDSVKGGISQEAFSKAWAKERAKGLQNVIDKTQGLEAALKSLSDVTLGFQQRLKSAVDAGKVGKVEDLVPFARKELQIKIEKTAQKINDIEEARDNIRKNLEKEGKFSPAGQQVAIDAVFGKEQKLKFEQLKQQLEELKQTQSQLGSKETLAQINNWSNVFQNKLDQINLKFDEGSDKWKKSIKDLIASTKGNLETLPDSVSKSTEKALQDLKQKMKDAGIDLKNESKSWTDNLSSAFDGWANSFGNTLNEMVWGAETSFKDIARSFGKMITQMIIQKQMIEPMVSGFGSFVGSLTTSAQGNVFENGQHLEKYAKGAVIDQPTIFPMAKGAGLMAEEGPEAIMPLGRTKSGDLGVQSSGATVPSVEINVINNTGEEAEVSQQKTRWDGGKYVLGVVLDAANRNKGGFGKNLKASLSKV